MATGAPTSAAGEESPATALMEKVSNGYAGCGLLLVVTAQAKILIARHEHFLIHTAVGIVTGSAAFTEGFVFEDMRTALLSVAPEAGLVRRSLRGRATLDGAPFMRIMAVRATYFAFFHGMVVGQTETAALIEMALVTRF